MEGEKPEFLIVYYINEIKRKPEQRCPGLFVCRKINAPYKGAESEEKMKIINLLNMKGGVAKTFTVVNMAYELWRRGLQGTALRQRQILKICHPITSDYRGSNENVG